MDRHDLWSDSNIELSFRLFVWWTCFSYAVNGPTEGTHREGRLRHKTVTIIWELPVSMLPGSTIFYRQLQQLTSSVYFCSRLHVSFHPATKRFRFHRTLATLVPLATIASGQPLPLLPRNCRIVSSTFTIFWDSHCWCGAMAAVSQQDFKTPRC